jgi:hypothetical protein
VDAFARNYEALPATLHETFLEGLRQRLPQGMPNQEQYQDQKQEQKTRATRGADKTQAEKERTPLRAVPSDSNNKLVAIAKETLKLTNPNGSLESLEDAFRCVALQYNVQADRAAILDALNVALTERRAG